MHWDTGAYIPCGIWGYDARGERITHTHYLHCVQKCHAAIRQYVEERSAPKKLHPGLVLETARA